MAALFPVLLVLLSLQEAPAPAAASPQAPSSPASEAQQNQQSPTPKATEGQQTTQPSSGGSTVNDLFAIDRIRRDLERQPAIAFTIPDRNLPRYRVEIEGFRRTFQLPDWRSNFVIPLSPVPQPLGGSDFYEMQRLTTQPAAWGSSAFSNSDLLKMYGLTGAYGLAGVLIKKGMEARQNREVQQIRDEVRQELAEVEAHNARVAAGQADGSADQKKAADEKKKKQEEEEKKKKKKQDDGGK
jgi:hypothetical protein